MTGCQERSDRVAKVAGEDYIRHKKGERFHVKLIQRAVFFKINITVEDKNFCQFFPQLNLIMESGQFSDNIQSGFGMTAKDRALSYSS